MRTIFFIIPVFILLMNCQNRVDHAQEDNYQITPVISLLGDAINPVLMAGSDQELAFLKAEESLKQDANEENYIWLGRRKAYLQHYHEAIAIFTEAIQMFPNFYRLYRHRGHRYISTRQLDLAIADLKKAAMLIEDSEIEIEEDGIPNKLNQPLSNTQFNIYYHLGLSYYLKGEYENAAKAYEKCMEYSVNDDLLVATVDWYYMTLNRLNEKEKAIKLLDSVHDDMQIIENDSYFKRIKMYKGVLLPDSFLNADKNSSDYDLSLATQGYGVGNWYLLKGDTTQAVNIYQKVLEGNQWAAFGYIAAEADMHKLNALN